MFTWDEIYKVELRKGCSTRCDVIRIKDGAIVAPNVKNRHMALDIAEKRAEEDRMVIEGWLLGNDYE